MFLNIFFYFFVIFYSYFSYSSDISGIDVLVVDDVSLNRKILCHTINSLNEGRIVKFNLLSGKISKKNGIFKYFFRHKKILSVSQLDEIPGSCDGDEAVRWLKKTILKYYKNQEKKLLIFMDFDMPNKNGADAIHSIVELINKNKVDRQRVKIIAYSNNNSPFFDNTQDFDQILGAIVANVKSSNQQMLDAGADRAMQKPASRDLVVAQLEELYPDRELFPEISSDSSSSTQLGHIVKITQFLRQLCSPCCGLSKSSNHSSDDLVKDDL